MARFAHGTQIYVLAPSRTVPDENEVFEVTCVNSISPGDDTSEQLETTCLSSEAREYIAGLTTPGQGSIPLNPDPANPSHVRLFELSRMKGTTLKFAVGWSDGKRGTDGKIDDPAELNIAGDDFDLSTTRSWLFFEGYIAGFPFEFGQNAVVTSTVSIQRSGEMGWVVKA